MIPLHPTVAEALRRELNRIAQRAWRKAQQTGYCEVRMCINPTPGARSWSVLGRRSRHCPSPGAKYELVGTYNHEATEPMILADLEAMNPEPR